MNNTKAYILFIIILVAASVFYNYLDILSERPQSVHRWRQADCASIALMYHQNGMKFFQPETHNLTSDNMQSGKVATSEIPVFYYFIALLYKIFGVNEIWFRIFNTLFYLTAIFYLFKTFFLITKDLLWSTCLSLIFFASPVLVYYGNNFLTNIGALSFAIIAWSHFIHYYILRKQKYLYYCLILYLLAGAFKVSALLGFFAIGGGLLLDWIQKKKTFDNHLKKLLLFIPVVLVIGSWILYAHSYNLSHNTTYFSTNGWPIWDYSKKQITGILKNVKIMWWKEYFSISMQIFLFIVFILSLIFAKHKTFKQITLLTFLGVIAYIILQFWTFSDHDYYTIDLYTLPVIAVTTLLFSFNHLKQKRKLYIASSVLLVVFIAFNVNYTQNHLTERYTGWRTQIKTYEDLHHISPFLRHIGIANLDTAICVPDISHSMLYFTNLRGWTDFKKYIEDSAAVSKCVKNGAKYLLVINPKEELEKRPHLYSFIKDTITNYNNVFIYQLKGEKLNYSPSPIKDSVFCNAELVNNNGKFLASNQETTLDNGSTQSNLNYRSGNNASLLNSSNPYGMTLELNTVRYGEKISASVWCYPKNSKGYIVIQHEGKRSIFLPINSSSTKDSLGWKKLEVDWYVPSKIDNKSLKIFTWNPSADSIWFDDFTCKVYSSFLSKK